MNIKLRNDRPLTDSEFIEYLDYALDLLGDFEIQADAFRAAIGQKQTPTLA